MGKEERIWWEMWVKEQEKGCRGSVLGLTGGENVTTGDGGEVMTGRSSGEGTYIYAFLGVKNIDNGKWGKRNGYGEKCGLRSRKRGAGKAF